ncbi:DNA-directed RNA polymerase subunit beta' [bacterium]|nr:DNA-directed RNA polymerase subunit beta' [bacterium]
MANPSTISTLVLSNPKQRQPQDFDEIRMSLASTEQIKSWSHGEVTKPETINYRSRKPERDGLFCQRIFGPIKDWQCACGKYKKLRYKGIVCDRCGVEVTRSLVRRERFGHIELAAPVAHIWFLRSLPSKIGLILQMSIQSLEKVIYFANFIITEVHEDLKKELLTNLEKEYKAKRKELISNKTEDDDILALGAKYKETKKEIMDLTKKKLLTEFEYRELSLKYGHIFSADIGAEAIFKLLAQVDLGKMVKDLQKKKNTITDLAKRKKIVQRIKYIRSFISNKIKPEDMVLRMIPVIPPELRPLVPLDGGRFASSDLNDLYRRVINRNNRLKRLYDLKAPEVILRNEKRMLQEAVDALFDNNMRSGKTVLSSTGQRRSLKSLADILKGKQGRFRQNLLGKRVDYSGRSVIVVGPKLKLDQCGLPKIMAIELFKPFIASKLIKRGLVHNVRSANRLIEQKTEEVWAILEEIIKESYVLLNRAPTLHRLGIQGFRPVLVEGKAIQIHPLVCTAFNADFDGDTMSVHVPITDMAKKEVEDIILSTNNLLKPATGNSVVTPTKDMVWGVYYMTFLMEGKKEKMRVFSSEKEAILAYKLGKIELQERIKVRIDKNIREVSVGRIIFNSALPPGLYNMDKTVDSKELGKIITKAIDENDHEEVVKMLDKIKEDGFNYLTISGLSFGMNDLPRLKAKDEIIQETEKQIREISSQYEMGLLAEDERYLKTIEAWIDAKDKVTDSVKKNKPAFSSVFSMVESGARGSWSQFVQMVGMRGIVRSPSGKLIELPIKSSLKEGYNTLEYFISSHGSRKGSSDTALRTAKAGYLTRRMVDVSQDLLIVEKDCGENKGLLLTREDNEEMVETWENRLFGRTSAQTLKDPKTKKIIIKPNEIITREKAKLINKINPPEFSIHSALTCKSHRGICAKCYGYDLAYNKMVKVGTPVGIIAAQSIGEPGTQLTLRTFHTGGIAETDITQGLPRVEELFEARSGKGQAFLAPADGKASVVNNDEEKKIIIKYQINKKEIHHLDEEDKWDIKVKDGQKIKKREVLAFNGKKKISARNAGQVKIDDQGNITVIYKAEEQTEFDATNRSIWVKDKAKVKAGEQLTDGSLDLHELYRLRGRREVEKYILREVQHIYSSQGQHLNDKHVEMIIRQMFSRCLVEDGGDTDLLPGEIIPKGYLLDANKKLKDSSQKKAVARELLLGITKVSLSTDSWLSAASFQETSRVLVNAAINGRSDYLRGLKENVIIGRLIPAGTGLRD